MKCDTGSTAELFFAHGAEPFDPQWRETFSTVPDGEWHRYDVPVVSGRTLHRIRVDPGGSSGEIAIRRLAVYGEESRSLGPRALQSQLGASHNLEFAGTDTSGALRFRIVGEDPWQEVAVPAGVGARTATSAVLHGLSVGFAAGLAWLILDLVGTALIVFANRSGRVQHLLSSMANTLSDEGVLRASPGVVVVLLLAGLGWVAYVGLDLNQSSIEVWEELYPRHPTEQMVELGTAKRVRSDEWNTLTPWVLNQVLQGGSEENVSVGGEKAPFIASVPVWHLSALPLFRYYGFLLFDLETGYSWMWAHKAFGLFLAYFWLLSILTRGDLWSSLLGATWVYGSSYTQWWYSTQLAEILIIFAVATTGSIYLLLAQRRAWIVVGALLLGYAVANVPQHLYPPSLVPLAYLGIAVVLGLLIQPGGVRLSKEQLHWRVGTLACLLLVLGALLGHLFVDAHQTIKTMMSTVYPGRRVSASGTFPVWRVFYGLFEPFRFGERGVPAPFPNPCEASNFLILWPIALFAVSPREFLRRQSALTTALCAYAMIVAAWMSTSLPAWIERPMQALGWSYSPPNRSLVGAGIGSILLVTVLLASSRKASSALRSESARQMIPMGVFLAAAIYGWGLSHVDPAFFNAERILLGALVAALVAGGAVLGRLRPFALGIILVTIPPLTVNPLISGISSLRDKPLFVAAREQSHPLRDRWIVVGDLVISQGLKAQGLSVLSGSTMVPNLELATTLDPDRRHESVWNRYAHIVITSKPGLAEPEFSLIPPDVCAISLDICSGYLGALRVTHLAYTDPVPSHDMGCLRELSSPPNAGVRLFRYEPQPPAD